MNEFRNTDVPEMQRPGIENYKNIKPENGTTVKDARGFVEDVFKERKEVEDGQEGGKRCENIDGHKHYYDDNGKLYRIDNDLQENTDYTVNGYQYKTDEMGRISEAKGKLHLKQHEGYKNITDSLHDIGKGDENARTDDKGHLIGDQFGGSDGMENAIPQDMSINRGAYKTLENELAAQVKSGNDVRVKIEPIYSGASRRPDGISVTYSINGEKSIRIFPNRSE